jgi:hypothetical protein
MNTSENIEGELKAIKENEEPTLSFEECREQTRDKGNTLESCVDPLNGLVSIPFPIQRGSVKSLINGVMKRFENRLPLIG